MTLWKEVVAVHVGGSLTGPGALYFVDGIRDKFDSNVLDKLDVRSNYTKIEAAVLGNWGGIAIRCCRPDGMREHFLYGTTDWYMVLPQTDASHDELD
jgi:hypothetical protein